MSEDLIPAELHALIERAVPGAEPTRACGLGEGWVATAYRVPHPEGDLALRLARPHADRFSTARDDFEREVDVLRLLEKLELPSPQAAHAIHDASGRFIGTVHRLIEGDPLTRARLGRGRRRARLAEEIASFLTRLHGVPLERASAAGVREIDLWADRYERLFRLCGERLGPRSRSWLEEVRAGFLAGGGLRGAPRALVHADVAPPHLLVDDEGRLAGVIDFADAVIADPALDFAGLLHAYGWPFANQALALYGGEVDGRFRDRMRFYVEVVPIFLVRYGHLFNDGQDLVDGLRQFAARAAAATRARRTGRDQA